MSSGCTCFDPCKETNFGPLHAPLQEHVALGGAPPEGQVPEVVLLALEWLTVLEVDSNPARHFSDVGVLGDGEDGVVAVCWVL